MASSNACGRHISISAHMAGYSDRMSYYVMDESEVILGVAEDGVVEAASKIIRSRRPKILLIYVCCSTYISGLDNERLRQRVKSENPDTEVLVVDMNPVAADTHNPPAVATQKKILGLLDFTDTRDDIVNLIGSDAAPDAECELYPLLKGCGVKEVKHLTLCRTYDDFLRMGMAGTNLVLSVKAMSAAKEIRNARHIPLFPTNSVDRVKNHYRRLSESLGVSFDLDKYAKSAEDHVRKVSDMVKGMTVSVGSMATERPFDLARSLVDYGFDVRSVFHSGISKAGKEDLEYLQARIPDLKIYDCGDPAMSSMVGKCGSADIAIGFNAAYFTMAQRSVDIVQDRGLFGFYGIERLMDKIEESTKSPTDFHRQVENANLVI